MQPATNVSGHALTIGQLAASRYFLLAGIMLPGSEDISRGERARAPSADCTFALIAAGGIAGLLHLIGVFGFGRGFEMVTIARNLAEHGVFADPFDAGHTGPTAANPPIYPLLLACWFRILGDPNRVTYAAAIGNMVVNTLTAILLPRVSLVLLADYIPGVIASILCLAAMQLLPAWDTGYTVACLLLFLLFSASATGQKSGVWRGVPAGLAGGVVALLNPSCLLVILPWLAFLAARRRAVVWCVAIIAGIALAVSVWLVRNDLRLGAPVLRTNFGMTVYASNNDCAASSLLEDEREGCYEAHHPNTSREEAQLVRSLGEVAYDRKRTADAVHWITLHPDRFRRLTLRRIREFWFPSPGPVSWPAAVVWLITALSIPGLILMARRREASAVFLLAVLGLYPSMYYIVVADIRYRYPVLWISALAAGYFLADCRLRLNRRFPALLM